MRCLKCKSDSKIRIGMIRGVQRYKCKSCGRHYTIEIMQNTERKHKRRFALSMYLEGLGFHSIGRLLGVSHVSVPNWVRKYGRELDAIRNPHNTQIVELDEINTYVGQKKSGDGCGLAWCHVLHMVDTSNRIKAMEQD